MSRLFLIVSFFLALSLTSCNERWGREDFIYPTESELQDTAYQHRLVNERNMLVQKEKIKTHLFSYVMLFLTEGAAVALYLYHIRIEDKERLLRKQEEAMRLYAAQVNDTESQLADKQRQINGLTAQLLHDNRLMLVDQLIRKTDKLFSFKENPRKLSPDELSEMEHEVNRTFDRYEKRLAASVPSLTESELALCSLIKLGLSVKDIATVICIEPASVSRRKLRIKDKVASVAGGFDSKRTIDRWLREF